MAKKAAVKRSNKSLVDSVDILNALGSLVPEVTPKSKSNKWELNLGEDNNDTIERWVAAKTLLEPVKARLDQAKSYLVELCMPKFVERLWELKNRPSNPLLKTRNDRGQEDCGATFMFTDKFTLNFPEVPQGVSAREHFVNVFEQIGLTRQNSESLYDNEIVMTPIIGVRRLDELLNGRFGENREFIPATEKEQSAARKLIAFIGAISNGKVNVDPLTMEEKALILERDNKVTVKAGFCERVTSYADSPEQVLAIFTVIKPVVYPAYPSFAMNSDGREKTGRLMQVASEILGDDPQD